MELAKALEQWLAEDIGSGDATSLAGEARYTPRKSRIRPRKRGIVRGFLLIRRVENMVTAGAGD